jgi:hypothetical protein
MVDRRAYWAYLGMTVHAPGRVPMRILATIAVGASLAGLLAGCSQAFDNPFPSVHEMPAPRAETPMTPEQVKQATDALESERNRLSTATPAAPAAPATAQAAPATTGSTKTAGATTKP